MTPALPDILMGHFLTLGSPLPPEASGDFLAARMGMLGLLSVLAAQEAERGPAARVWENQAMRDLFARLAHGDRECLHGVSTNPNEEGDGDGSWSALDAANAKLRRQLIEIHEAAEKRQDTDLEREILQLYQAMAEARRLDLPGALGG